MNEIEFKVYSREKQGAAAKIARKIEHNITQDGDRWRVRQPTPGRTSHEQQQQRNRSTITRWGTTVRRPSRQLRKMLSRLLLESGANKNYYYS